MKRLKLALAIVVGAYSVAAAMPADHAAEERFKAKYGRSSPAKEARDKAQDANTAYREETAGPSKQPNWADQYLRKKWGRTPPKQKNR